MRSFQYALFGIGRMGQRKPNKIRFEVGRGETLTRLLAGGHKICEPAAFVMHAVWPVDVGWGNQRDQHRRRCKSKDALDTVERISS
jgi:hypothetical protein